MKLALVHEWLTNLAGSERVLLAMHELWPDAPVHTALYRPAALPAEFGPGALDVRASFLQRVPGAARAWRWCLPFLPAAFESFDLSGYQVVLSSCHACAKGVLTPAETCHVCYCYTPIRYAWEMPHAYLAEASPPARRVLRPVLARLRVWDLAAAQRVDRFLACSATVRRRIEKHYRRAAEVIHPPVDTARFAPAAEREDVYLVVSRLVGYKRVELAVAALGGMGRRLQVIGGGPQLERLRRLAGPTVELLGEVSDDAVAAAMGRARALIFPGVEDFGLTPVEAQAAGCPVIAFAAGGATETVVDGETGLFFAEPTAAALQAAVRRFEATTFDPAACVANARRFDRSLFAARLRGFVEAAWAEHGEQLRHGAR